MQTKLVPLFFMQAKLMPSLLYASKTCIPLSNTNKTQALQSYSLLSSGIVLDETTTGLKNYAT